MPRQHSHPSTVATLRKLIAQHRGRPFTQADLARRSGAARITIQSIERGVLALSEQLARRIAEATGAGAEWLLRGKPSSQPKDAHGRLLTREIWLAHESDLPKRHGSPEQGHSRQARHRVLVNLSGCLAPLASAATAAAKARRLDLFAADLFEAVSKLEARYGKSDSVFISTIKALMDCKSVTVAEPGFPATLPQDRLCHWRALPFRKVLVPEGQQLDFAAMLDNPAFYAVTVEVKPSATAQEIRTLYPRPKGKAAKKAAKGRKKTA
jgi:transcriptional regulator with XRE-family HTH domain